MSSATTINYLINLSFAEILNAISHILDIRFPQTKTIIFFFNRLECYLICAYIFLGKHTKLKRILGSVGVGGKYLFVILIWLPFAPKY